MSPSPPHPGLIVAAFATTPVFLAPLLKATIAAAGPAAAMRNIGNSSS
jgi:hypothetical protein